MEVRFPPYTGGCIVGKKLTGQITIVSSLYGRVYRDKALPIRRRAGFLPTREGVSYDYARFACGITFPPYTGGCIVTRLCRYAVGQVSSLHGRVYRMTMPDLRVA